MEAKYMPEFFSILNSQWSCDNYNTDKQKI